MSQMLVNNTDNAGKGLISEFMSGIAVAATFWSIKKLTYSSSKFSSLDFILKENFALIHEI